MPKPKRSPLPFHTDLNGFERVSRPFARKAWARGIPVWQDDGTHGAVLLDKPVTVPEAQSKLGFDAKCLQAAGWSGKAFTKWQSRRCIYLIKYGVMALHFTFKDGSNPFVKYGVAAELLPEIEDWSHRYYISPDKTAQPDILAFVLEEKNPAPKGLFAPGP